MDLSLFNGHGSFFWRYLHVFFGIIWIGHLYYFNFVQTPFFAETDNNTKSGAIQKLVPRALWWFRWGAMFTFITGLLLMAVGLVRGFDSSSGISMMEVMSSNLTTQWGSMILPGFLLGTLMFLNVWLIIWPNQKIVIASTTAVATGGQADPRAAAAGARAGVVSRTNALFSVPMLFSMVGTSHFEPITGISPSTGSLWAYLIIMCLLIGACQANAMFGKLIGPLKTVRGVVTAGFVFSLVYYVLVESFLVGSAS